MRISPQLITELSPNEIFCFGSNTGGRHGAGAAKTALKWGAVYGQGVGLFGQTYAIPTLNKYLEQLSLEMIQEYVNDFILFAISRPHLNFLVTEVGCGLAGFKVSQMAPLFKEAKEVENIFLPKSFWSIYK
jgi:hypothetical protein